MRQGIHPEYPEATITCACGVTHKVRSTTGDYTVDICSQCHPFYTGKQRVVDTAGRVERFKRKFAKAEKLKAERKAREDAAAEKAADETAADAG